MVLGRMRKAVRLFGTRAKGPDAVRIVPYLCKKLKDPIKYLGIILMSSLGPKKHFQDRAAKGTAKVGQLNSIVARYPGMPFREEWMLWNVFGWSPQVWRTLALAAA